jgi:hypothetical protein
MARLAFGVWRLAFGVRRSAAQRISSPEGQNDRSPARRASRGPAPQGIQDSAQGFSPGNLKIDGSPEGERGGYERKLAPIAAQKSDYAIGTFRIGPSDPASALLGRSIWRPSASGRVALGGRFPGLKPWAEFWSPCGAQKRPQPKDCGRQPFRSKIILNLIFAPFLSVPENCWHS